MAATAAGLLVGAYHFCDASQPMAQAAHFLAVAGAFPMLALDVEDNGMGMTCSPAQAAEIVARLQMSTSRLPLVYIPRYGPYGDGSGLPNAILARCSLWLPTYHADPADETPPTLPPGWSGFALWQYTNAGSVPGVSGPCDRSRYAGTVDELRAWWQPPRSGCP